MSDGAQVTAPAADSGMAALERLADAFDSDDFTISLSNEEGPPFSLTVASRHCPLREDIFVEGQFYWFGWAEPVGPVDEPAAAAAKIARVLRAVPEPTHG